MSKLKPCPFCGGKAELLLQWKSDEGTGKNIWARCEICGVVTSNYGTEEEAEDAWNRRADIGNPATESKPIEIDGDKNADAGITMTGNEPLTCKGCEYHDENVEWPDRCYACVRQSRRDLYRQPKEAHDGQA